MGNDMDRALGAAAGMTDELPIVPTLGPDDEVLELGEGFDLDGFQVVRREFFAHLREPSVTFKDCKIYVNQACLAKFPSVDYVQVLINRDTKIMALRPCHEGARDSFRWSTISKGRRKPKQTTGTLFFAKLSALMGWNPDYRYKLLGKIVCANGEYLIAFDLTATEVYMRTFPEGERPRTSRTPVFPAEWKTQFGLPLKEHKQSLQINIFDGYAVFSVSDKEPPHSETPEAAPPLLDRPMGGAPNAD